MVDKRLQKIEKLEDLFLLMIHKEVKDLPKDGEWRKYKSVFKFKREKYDVVMEYRITQDYFSYRDYKVTPHTIHILELN